MNSTNTKKRQFIDLFSGCGGLSLGLVQGGWQGRIAIEKSTDAFATFEANFIKGPKQFRFDWPDWLKVGAHGIDEVLANEESKIRKLRGSIDLVAGGPPCQGFSMAGKRQKSDPRNFLFQRYVQFVDDVRPKAVVVENVPGMKILHGKMEWEAAPRPGPIPKTYYDRLIHSLSDIGYTAIGDSLDAADFGVPQRRPRLIVVGLRNDLIHKIPGGLRTVFDFIEASRVAQLATLGLHKSLSAKEAISDLIVGRRTPIPYDGPGYGKGYVAPDYQGPKTRYQYLMHEGFSDELMDSIRLAKHSSNVIARFRKILSECRKGVTLNEKDRRRLKMSKHRTFLMDADKPAPTITTLPDDVLHYSEPRILSVRENARIQSFPDWFKFRGKYTTGGKLRKKECPRYTQVGNAVPPLMARAIGIAIANALEFCDQAESGRAGTKNHGETKGAALASAI